MIVRKKYKKIYEAFKGLDFIVFRGRYLIPQRPQRVYVNQFIGMQDNIVNSFKSGLPEITNLELIERAKDPEKRNAVIEQYRFEM